VQAKIHILSYNIRMKTILIMRHGKSSKDDPSLEDQDRPLNKRGEKDAPRMGELLHKENLVPEAILSSPAKRAKDTAAAAAKTSKFEGEIQLVPGFYNASPDAFWQALSSLPDSVQQVMLVGHNPDLEELLQNLTGEMVRMSTAAIALVEMPLEHWSDFEPGLTGKLVKVWRPKELAEE
jgi:phosphohistidine phosphatase